MPTKKRSRVTRTTPLEISRQLNFGFN